MKILISLVFVTQFIACCGITFATEPLPKIEYSCEIPKGLKRQLFLHHKNNKKEKRDAHAIYKRYHSEGWHGLMSHYVETGNTTYNPFPPQEYGIMTMARGIGISEARTLILKSELVFGVERLLAILKNVDLSVKATQSEQNAAEQPASRPAVTNK